MAGTYEWFTLSTENGANVNAAGFSYSNQIAAGTSVVKVICDITAQRISAPAGGTVPRPTYGQLTITGQQGSNPQRTLHKALIRPHAQLSTYVPSGSSNTYWYLEETWGYQDFDNPYQVAIGGPGQQPVDMRTTFGVFTLPAAGSSSELWYYKIDLRYLLHTAA